MQFIKALSLAPTVSDWLMNSHRPRILHVFDHACNLINEHREVLSIVIPQIGNSPFNLVVEDKVLFSDHLNTASRISICDDQLHLGDLIINTSDAELWSPHPDWEMLHTEKAKILNRLILLSIPNDQSQLPNSLVSSFSIALANADPSSYLTIAQKLAGLGQGLTPSGDDFILGAVLAAWIIHPPEVAKVLAEEITNIAAPLTTSLSAAWLKSAGRGEAGILWHQFFKALVSADPAQVQETVDNIIAVGETSGADALSGFVHTFSCWSDASKRLHSGMSRDPINESTLYS